MARPMRPNRQRQTSPDTIVPMPPGPPLTAPPSGPPTTLPPTSPIGLQPQPAQLEAQDVLPPSTRSSEEQNELERKFETAREEARLGFAGRYGGAEILGPTGRQRQFYYTAPPLGLEGAGTTYDLGMQLDESGNFRSRRMFGIDVESAPTTSAGRVARAFGGTPLYGTTVEQAAAGQLRLLDEEGARRELFSLSTNDLAQVKLGLVAIGALDPDSVGLLNVKDITSSPKIQAGFNRLVGVAQANGMQWQQLLGRMINNGETFAGLGAGPGGGPGAARPQIRLTNPDNLRTIAQDVAMRTLGRGLMPDEAERFVTSYQDMERNYQMSLAGGAGEVTSAPAADVAAETMLRQEFEQEYDVYQMGSTLDTFQRILAGQL